MRYFVLLCIDVFVHVHPYFIRVHVCCAMSSYSCMHYVCVSVQVDHITHDSDNRSEDSPIPTFDLGGITDYSTSMFKS